MAACPPALERPMGACSYCAVWSRSARRPICTALVQGHASSLLAIISFFRLHFVYLYALRLLWKWNSIIVYIGSAPPYRVKAYRLTIKQALKLDGRNREGFQFWTSTHYRLSEQFYSAVAMLQIFISTYLIPTCAASIQTGFFFSA